MNPFVIGFRALSAAEQANAGQKVSYARGAINWNRGNGGDPQDDSAVVHLFDLADMSEFWDVELSEPILCATFAQRLSLHFLVIKDRPGLTDEQRIQLGHAARRVVDGIEGGIRMALRDARTDREPWFIELPPQDKPLDTAPTYRKVLIHSAVIGPPKQDYALVVPPDPPSDGIDLSRLKVRPRPAVEWLLAMPRRRHLVPASLIAYLALPVPVDAKPTATLSYTALESGISSETSTTPKQSVNRGGRAKVYDWGGAGGFIAGYIDKHDPQTEADLKRALTAWFTDQGKEPDEREVSRFVKEAWKTKRN